MERRRRRRRKEDKERKEEEETRQSFGLIYTPVLSKNRQVHANQLLPE